MSELNEREYKFFIDKIKNKEYFSYLNFGDGEWSFIFDKKANSEREIYYEETRKELIEAIKLGKEKNVYLSSIDDEIPDIVDLLVSPYQKELKDGRMLYTVIWALNHREKEATRLTLELLDLLKDAVFIGNTELDFKKIIKTKSPGATEQREINRVEQEILNYGKSGIYIFSCGIAGNVLIKRLHGKINNSFLLDLGAFFDFFYEKGVRAMAQFDNLWKIKR
jgi:hypothetical protein